MTRARDVAFIRKLCGLSLPSQVLVQTLLPALRGLIPSHSAGVFWVDSEGEMTRLYAERLLPPDAMAAYHERHYPQRAAGFAAAFRARAQQPDSVSFHTFTRAEQSTAYFQDVMTRLDAYHVLYGILREHDLPFAQISFYRGSGDRAFSPSDANTLREVLRYVATGLARQGRVSAPDDPSVVIEEQLGIVQANGRIVSAPEPWYRLLRLVALAEVSPRHAAREAAIVEEFVRRACAGQAGGDKRSARHGEQTFESAWGRFTLRAFGLPDINGRGDDQFGLLVRREEPRSVALVRGTGSSALSPQQREVALLVAHGRTNAEIAEALGLSLNTASYHVKQVFARLDVNDRNAVAERLLTLGRQ